MKIRLEFFNRRADDTRMKQKLTCDLVVGDTIQTGSGFDETITALAAHHEPGFRVAIFGEGCAMRALLLPPETLWDLVENKS